MAVVKAAEKDKKILRAAVEQVKAFKINPIALYYMAQAENFSTEQTDSFQKLMKIMEDKDEQHIMM